MTLPEGRTGDNWSASFVESPAILRRSSSGFLALNFSQNKDLTDQDLHLLGSLGNFLGGAVENTRLLMTIHKHREELKGLTARLFQSQEMERRRIARELHDEVGQAPVTIDARPRADKRRPGVSDTGALTAQIDELLESLPEEHQRLRAGDAKVIGYLVGQVMRLSGGKADPKVVSEILREKAGG